MHICILIIYFINSDHKSNLIVIISFLLCNLEEFGLVIHHYLELALVLGWLVLVIML